MAYFKIIKDRNIFRAKGPSFTEYEFHKDSWTLVEIPEDIAYFRKHNLTYKEKDPIEKSETKKERKERIEKENEEVS